MSVVDNHLKVYGIDKLSTPEQKYINRPE